MGPTDSFGCGHRHSELAQHRHRQALSSTGRSHMGLHHQGDLPDPAVPAGHPRGHQKQTPTSTAANCSLGRFQTNPGQFQ